MNDNISLTTMGKNLILLSRALEIIREFKRKDIDFLILRGLYLAFAVYPDAGSRPMADVDLLVKRVDLNKVNEILTGLEYADVTLEAQRIDGCEITFCNKHPLFYNFALAFIFFIPSP